MMQSILRDFRVIKDYDIFKSGTGLLSTIHKSLTVQIEVQVFLEPNELPLVIQEKLLLQAENIGMES